MLSASFGYCNRHQITYNKEEKSGCLTLFSYWTSGIFGGNHYVDLGIGGPEDLSQLLMGLNSVLAGEQYGFFREDGRMLEIWPNQDAKNEHSAFKMKGAGNHCGLLSREEAERLINIITALLRTVADVSVTTRVSAQLAG